MRFLEWIYPPKCVFCRALPQSVEEKGRFERLGLCEDCFLEDYFMEEPEKEGGHVSFRYEDQLRKALHRLKYEGAKRYGSLMAHWMMEEGNGFWRRERFDLVTAVPLSLSRRKSRGYNQAELIATELAAQMGITYKELLVRTKETRALKNLSSSMRKLELSGAFEVKPEQLDELSGKKILLVDDILTTGETIRECTRTILDKAPEATVFFWALAYDEPL